MESLKINDISLADCPIVSIILSENKDEMLIISKASIRISDLKKYNQTHVKIYNWTTLLVRKYIITKPFVNGEFLEIDWKLNFETFDFIQEIIFKENKLLLNGFSKESGAWLTYQFTEFEYEIIIN